MHSFPLVWVHGVNGTRQPRMKLIPLTDITSKYMVFMQLECRKAEEQKYIFPTQSCNVDCYPTPSAPLVTKAVGRVLGRLE